MLYAYATAYNNKIEVDNKLNANYTLKSNAYYTQAIMGHYLRNYVDCYSVSIYLSLLLWVGLCILQHLL